MGRSGFTLTELLIGTFLLVIGGGAALMGMRYGMIHMEYLSQFQVAMNAAQGKLEELSAASFATLWRGSEYAAAQSASGQRIALSDLPGGALVIQIRNADIQNSVNPSLLDLHVAACWEHRGRRIGENDGAQNCVETTGVAYPTPGWEINSPVMVSTRIARRED